MLKKPITSSRISTYLLALIILGCIAGCIVVQVWYARQEKLLNGRIDNYYETQAKQK
jgi:hypothetical protein